MKFSCEKCASKCKVRFSKHINFKSILKVNTMTSIARAVLYFLFAALNSMYSHCFCW